MPKAQDSSFLGWSIIDVTGATLLSNANITLTKDIILVFDISNLSLVNRNTYTITIDCKIKQVPVVTISCCLGCFDPVEDDTTTVSTIVELGKAVTKTMKMGEK